MKHLFALFLLLLAAPAAATPAEYTLLGFNLNGIHGVDTQALAAKLKHKPGDRVTRADISKDAHIVEQELQALHVKGHLFTSMAEKNGRVWVIFDLLNDNGGQVFANQRRLEAQLFEGATRLSADALAEASGLKPGDVITPETLDAARAGIAAAYAKVAPGKKVEIAGKMQGKADGKAVLTWVIREPR